MKRILFACSLVLTAPAHADPLSDAMKAWEQREFSRARTLFGELARAGNPQAQLMLGEMLGFGEGGAEEPALADQYLASAAAAGLADATSSRANVRQRAVRRAEIVRYANEPHTAVTLAGFGCVLPSLPEQSRTQKEIKAVNGEVLGWRQCYERYGAQLQASSTGHGVPAALADLMNLDELARARAAEQVAVTAAIAAANGEAAQFAAAVDGWFKRTSDFITSMEKEKRDASDRRQREIDDVTARYRAVMQAPGK